MLEIRVAQYDAGTVIQKKGVFIALAEEDIVPLIIQLIDTPPARAQGHTLLAAFLQSEAAQCTAVGMLQAAHEQAEAEAPPFHWTLEDEHGETMYGD